MTRKQFEAFDEPVDFILNGTTHVTYHPLPRGEGAERKGIIVATEEAVSWNTVAMVKGIGCWNRSLGQRASELVKWKDVEIA